MHSQHSRARSRSLSFCSSSTRSVRARPATAPAPTAAAIPGQGQAGPQAATDALHGGAGLGLCNEPQSGTANAVPASPAAYSDTQVGSEQSDAESGVWAEAEDNEVAAAAAAAAAPVLKRGGKAEHCTLGTVSIISIGGLGAKIEYFSLRTNTVRERQVLLSDLEPLPDEDPIDEDAGTP